MIESILLGLGLFAATFWFWPVLAIAFLLLWVFSEHEQLGWSTLITVIVGILAFSRWPEIGTFLSSPINIGIVVISYVAIGIAWSFYKWYVKNRKERASFIEIKDKFFLSKSLPSDYFSKPGRDPAITKQFVETLRRNYLGVYEHHTFDQAMSLVIPKANKNKKSIMMWGAYWPMSAVWFILNDFVTEIAEWVYEHLGQIFQRISNAMFKDVLK